MLAVDLSVYLSVEQNVSSTSLKWDVSIKLSPTTTDPMSTANVPPKPLVNLYGDSELPPYFEEIVEPKSFRNRLINVLIWTTLLPLILLLFFLQKTSKPPQKFKTTFSSALREKPLFMLNLAYPISEANSRWHSAPTAPRLRFPRGAGHSKTCLHKIQASAVSRTPMKQALPHLCETISHSKLPNIRWQRVYSP